MKFFKNDYVLILKIGALNSLKLPKMVFGTQIKTFLVVSNKKFFLKNFNFFELFCRSGVMKFFKID